MKKFLNFSNYSKNLKLIECENLSNDLLFVKYDVSENDLIKLNNNQNIILVEKGKVLDIKEAVSIHGRAAHHERLVDIHAGGQMGRASLQCAELHGPGLAADLGAYHVGQIVGGAGELFVPKCVHVVRISRLLADIAAIGQLDALGDGHHHGVLLLQEISHLIHEIRNVEGKLRQENHIGTAAVLALGQRGGAGQPAGVAAHDLDDRDQFLLIGESKPIADDLLGGGGDVLGRAPIARRVVRQSQIVVDGLRHAHEFLGLSRQDGVIGQLLDRVHGIVSADVDEALHVQLVEDLENLHVDLLVLVDGRQLVAAGAEKGRRRPL